MDEQVFNSFFEPYSKNVDKVIEVSAFWRLSDEIITEIIRREVAPYCTEDSLVMDAGGGTGRWAVRLSQFLRGKIVVFDRSVDMLARARENISQSKVSNRIDVVEGDLTDIQSFANQSVSHIVSIYSPLSFIYEQEKAAQELYRILRPGGRILVMSHAFHNAIASKINNYHASSDELKTLAETRMIKWASHVPELITHSQESVRKLFADAGFSILKTYGVPVFVQPGPEDFDPNNERKSSISKYLENPDVFSEIFELEMQQNSIESVANRGMNVFLLAEKK